MTKKIEMPIGMILVYWVIGALFSCALMLGNDALLHPIKYNPLVVITMLAGPGFVYFWLFKGLSTNRLRTILRYTVTGMCLGAYIIGLIYSTDNVKHFGTFAGIMGILLWFTIPGNVKVSTKDPKPGMPLD